VSDWPIPWAPVAGSRTGALAWLESVLAEGTLGGLSRLPAGAQDALAGMLARVAMRVDPRHTRAAREFLAQALPSLPAGEREALVLQSWRYFLMLLLRNVAFDRHVPLATRVSHYAQEFSPAAQEIFDRKTPCIVITAHVGPNGEVDSSNVSSNSGLSPAVASCIAGVVRRATFAAPGGGGSTLNIPVTFVQQK